MKRFGFVTCDVFTEVPFGGNPLAVFHDAEGLSDAQMQALAAEMNLSETTFVLPPADPTNTARVRIFNRSAEMPFAGHPNVGTAFVLACLGRVHGEVLRFEELAGVVEVTLRRDWMKSPEGACIVAPQPLTVFGEMAPAAIARCLGLPTDALRLAEHRPTVAGVGVDFVVVELERGSLESATPVLDEFRLAQADYPLGTGRLSLLAYELQGRAIRSRMFAPLAGTWEDPATGSANAALAAFLVSRSGVDRGEFKVAQGVEMGRPSELLVRAWKDGVEIRASVEGSCVWMFVGSVEL